MQVLVTGGAGYIGSHTCKLLAQAGLNPIAYDNLSTGSRAAVRWGPLVVADIAETQALSKTIRDHRISAVIHLAGCAYVSESFENPRKYFHNNLTKTLAMLDCLLDRGVNRIVFSSTCAIYGLPAKLPIDENHPQHPINPYGESKLGVERALRWYGTAYGLRSVALRYFNAAGSDIDGELGERYEEETRLVPLALKAALAGEKPLSVFGHDYPTRDGTAIRDFVHVTDLASAHLLALNYLAEGNESRAFNLGAGAGHSVKEVIATVESVTGKRVSITPKPRRAGDPAELVADPTVAHQLLHWTPRYSDLETIIRTAWHWTSQQRAQRRTSLVASSKG